MNACEWLLRKSLGFGETIRDGLYQPRKSLSSERTFSAISEWNKLEEKCLEIAQVLAESASGLEVTCLSDHLEEQVEGRTVTIKLKPVTFEVKQKSITLSQ